MKNEDSLNFKTETSKRPRSARYGSVLILDPLGSTSRPTRHPKRVFPHYLHTVMSDNQRVVYLEDVETTALSTSSAENIPVTPSATASQDGLVKAAVKATEATGAVKRQRTLMDMLAKPNGKSAEPVAKKLKLSTSSSSSGSTKIAVSGVSVQRLNAIPFSLSQYIESIPEDHRHLLKLECDCMGKSWCVRRSHNNSLFCF